MVGISFHRGIFCGTGLQVRGICKIARVMNYDRRGSVTITTRRLLLFWRVYTGTSHT